MKAKKNIILSEQFHNQQLKS